MTILITGAAGYIGSHVADALSEYRDDFIGIDNLHKGLMSNLIGPCIVEDIRNEEQLRKLFEEYKPDTVFHLAALTSVPESNENRDEYESVNVDGTETLLKVMREFKCKNLIFSSTASVYRQSKEPLKETDPVEALNFYALSKYWAEQLIKKAGSDWDLNYIIFRYFNVIGYRDEYDKSKELEKTNIVPAFIRAKRYGQELKVFGNGYPVTRENPKDHTCVRDYIDVRDIARAHILAEQYMKNKDTCRDLFNLGTQNGSSVLELIDAFNKANKVSLTYTIENPRKGDPASLIANSTKAKELLGWEPVYSLEESLRFE